MDRLLRIINGVGERFSLGGNGLHWNVWFINREDRALSANLHVDLISHRSGSAIQRSLGSGSHEISVASAEGGVSGRYTDEIVQEMINRIVAGLEKSYTHNQST
jgi:hypothetical protein